MIRTSGVVEALLSDVLMIQCLLVGLVMSLHGGITGGHSRLTHPVCTGRGDRVQCAVVIHSHRDVAAALPPDQHHNSGDDASNHENRHNCKEDGEKCA